MNIGKGCGLLLTTSTGADVDVVLSYRESGKIKWEGPPKTKGLAYTAAQTKVELLTSGGVQPSAALGIELDMLSIRNKDTLATVATLWMRDADGSDFELYEETIGAGQELVYLEDVGWTLQTHGTIGLVVECVAPADVVNQSADVLADITGLSYAVIAGETYRFEANVPFTAGAGTTGLRVVANGPAMTFIRGESEYPLSATTKTLNNFSALQIPAAANADTVSGVAKISGTFKPSANGTFAIQGASENNVAAITFLAGASLSIKRTL